MHVSIASFPIAHTPKTPATSKTRRCTSSPFPAAVNTRLTRYLSIGNSVTPEHQEGFTKFSDASSLEAAFGTGPIPTSTLPSRQTSSVAATPRPSSPTDTETSQEIWEYRGNLLTRSALSLVLRQEALAKADSSGQYAGEVSWDDVRQSYVPKWAEKMRPEDVVEGEVPSTNPAEYRIKRKDAWGNEIGWREGVMFYKNEPSFDSPAD